MTREAYIKKIRSNVEAAEDAVQIYEEIAKDAQTGTIQQALNDRKQFIVGRLNEQLDAVDREYGVLIPVPDDESV